MPVGLFAEACIEVNSNAVAEVVKSYSVSSIATLVVVDLDFRFHFSV